MLKKYLSNFLDYIFPQFCLGCQQEGTIFCNACLEKMLILPIDPNPWPKENYVFNECHICLDYHDPVVKKLIKKYKYGFFDNLADPIADLYGRKLKKLNLNSNTIIANAPLHNRKKKKRGFDQTELIAKKISQATNIPYYNLLTRQKFTRTQAELDRIGRQKNLQQAFIINKKADLSKIINYPVLLIDDIATTGTTLNEASKVLKQAGFKHIICLALAKN